MSAVSEVTARYLNLYNDNIDRINGISSPYINSFRQKAFEKFTELGVPTRKNEDYKYTNLNVFFDHDYRSLFMPVEADFAKADEFRCDVADLDAQGIVLLNGFYPTLNGKLHQFPNGVWIGSLNEAAVRFPDLVEKHYGKYAQTDKDGLVHLNTAMASDGVFIYVPEGVVVAQPVQVVNLVHAEEDIFNQHRNLIIVEKNAEFTLIICDHTLSPGKFLTNAVTEAYVGENSHFDLIRVQNEHNTACKITHTFIKKERLTKSSLLGRSACSIKWKIK